MHLPKRRHPFVDVITTTPLCSQWEPFTLEWYFGYIDPDEHLKLYVTHIALYSYEDVVFCKAFLTTLKGPTLELFTSLPTYSIDSFDTLSHLFITHFARSHPNQATPLSFLSVRQEKDETIRAFINRFGKAVLWMPNLTQEMILQCMVLTRKPSPFADNTILDHRHLCTSSSCVLWITFV